MIRFICALFLAMVFFTPRAEALEVPRQEILHANRAYEQGRYQEAAATYERVLAQGWQNGHVYYNLGNAYYQQGQLGLAIRNFLDAQSLLPRDEDVTANLATALRQTEDLLDWEQPHPASALLFWLNDFTLREHVWALLGIHLAFWMILGTHLIHPGGATLLGSRMALGIFLAALISTGARWHLEEFQTRAVVSVKSLNVVAADLQPAQTLFQLHEGSIVKVVQERERWLEIKLPDGRRGWAPRDQLLT